MIATGISSERKNTWVRLAWLCSALILCVTVQALAQDGDRSAMPVVKDGRLELGAWNLTTDGPLPLNGEWEFYWEQMLTPADFARHPAPVKSGIIMVPSSWRTAKVGGQAIGVYGYGTYRLLITHPPQSVPLAIKFSTVFTASRFFINGRQVYTMGQPGTTKATTTPHFQSHVVSFTPQGAATEIVIQVANFHGKHGGIKEPITFGLARDITAQRDSGVATQMFLFGAILIIGIYFIVHFFFRTKEQALLYFGLFCVIIAIRQFFSGEQFISDAFPGFPWSLIRKADYLSIALGVSLLMMFIRELYPQETSPYAVRFIQIVMGALAAVVIVTPETIYGMTLEPIEAVLVIQQIYVLYVLVLSVIRKRRGAVFFLMGFILLFAAVIMDILQNLRILNTPLMIGYGLIAFILSQAMVIAFRFSRTFDAIESQAQAMQVMGREVSEGHGDLTKRLSEGAAEDAELNDQAHWFNRFLKTLDATLSRVKESSAVVDTATYEVAAGTQGLSQSSQTQAASVEEVAATIEEMSAAIRKNADDAQSGRAEARTMVSLANGASQVARDLIKRMDEMSGASRKISDIITTVNEVAFQTNLLALNAAVEAARAGEHGKGFAVVAGEVRSLAQRSADAARQIKTLIEDTVEKIGAGDEMAKRSVNAITEIITHIDQLSETMEGIAASSAEQAGSIDEISRAISQIDSSTQQNASTAEELSSTAERLRTEASELAEIVAGFIVSGYSDEES